MWNQRQCGWNDGSLCFHVDVLLATFPLAVKAISCCWQPVSVLLGSQCLCAGLCCCSPSHSQLDEGHPLPLLFLWSCNTTSEWATNFKSTVGGHPANLLLKYTDTQFISHSCWKKFVLEVLELFPWARIMSSIMCKIDYYNEIQKICSLSGGSYAS